MKEPAWPGLRIAGSKPRLGAHIRRHFRHLRAAVLCSRANCPVDCPMDLARVIPVQVVLRKLGRGSRAVAGRLVRAPRKGSVVVIEFSDGMHEYVTTPVKRVLRVATRDVFYIETVNSRYRLEVRDRERALEDASSG